MGDRRSDARRADCQSAKSSADRPSAPRRVSAFVFFLLGVHRSLGLFAARTSRDRDGPGEVVGCGLGKIVWQPGRAARPEASDGRARGGRGYRPVAREELIADLKQTDPSRWPLVIQEFRAPPPIAAERIPIVPPAPPDSSANGAHAETRNEAKPAKHDDRDVHLAERDEYGAPPRPKASPLEFILPPWPYRPKGALLGVANTDSAKDRLPQQKPGEATAIPIEPSALVRAIGGQPGCDGHIRPHDNGLGLAPESGACRVDAGSAGKGGGFPRHFPGRLAVAPRGGYPLDGDGLAEKARPARTMSPCRPVCDALSVAGRRGGAMRRSPPRQRRRKTTGLRSFTAWPPGWKPRKRPTRPAARPRRSGF